MPQFPEIQAPRPSTKPAEEEKSYPHAWMSNLHIMAPDPAKPIEVAATLRNYNRTTQELSPLPGDQRRLEISDLNAEADRATLVAQAVGVLLTCVNLLSQERVLQQTRLQALRDREEAQGMEEGPERDAAIAAAQAVIDDCNTNLATVRQNLGVGTGT